ncbi:hypothetical protein [Spirosoma telluris]|uniref:hypothetical protein n=1 Tax=Spirosoma telluris TaxID=2183553 RepID=UPI002FC32802
MNEYLLIRNFSRLSVCTALGILLIALTTRLSAQTITTVAGSLLKGDGGPALSAALNTPTGVAVDGLGNLFIADLDNHRVRKVAPTVRLLPWQERALMAIAETTAPQPVPTWGAPLA